MAKHLTRDQIKGICQTIDEWCGDLTWELLIIHLKQSLLQPYTRQGLSNHKKIQSSFSNRKKALLDSPSTKSSGSDIVDYLKARIQKQEAEIRRLKAVDDLRLSIHATWLYNAVNKGLTEEYLNTPLPTVDRQKTNFKGFKNTTN